MTAEFCLTSLSSDWQSTTDAALRHLNAKGRNQSGDDHYCQRTETEIHMVNSFQSTKDNHAAPEVHMRKWVCLLLVI
jgi:hypothetical protein